MQGYEETTTNFDAMVANVTDASDCNAVYLSSYITDAAGILEALAEADLPDTFSVETTLQVSVF